MDDDWIWMTKVNQFLGMCTHCIKYSALLGRTEGKH